MNANGGGRAIHREAGARHTGLVPVVGAGRAVVTGGVVAACVASDLHGSDGACLGTGLGAMAAAALFWWVVGSARETEE